MTFEFAAAGTAGITVGKQAILAAALDGDSDKVDALLKEDPDGAFKTDEMGATPLHYAAIGGRNDVAELLFAHRAGVDAADRRGVRPLSAAAAYGRKDVAEPASGPRGRGERQGQARPDTFALRRGPTATMTWRGC